MRKILFIVGLMVNVCGNAQWSELGGTNSSTFSGVITRTLTDVLGNIYATGHFRNALSYIYVAKWDGTSWSELGGTNSTVFSNPIISLTIDSNDNIYAGDDIGNIRKWNGISWTLIGSFSGRIYTLLCDAANNIYAAGAFKNTANNYYVAKWDGVNWGELGGSSIFNGVISTLGKDIYGNIYAGGFFYHPTPGYNQFIAKWDGSNWITTGSAALIINADPVCIYGDPVGNVYAGGYFYDPAGGTPLPRYFEKYDGNSWQVIATFDSKIMTITTDKFNNIYAAGDFFIPTSNIRYVSKYDGNSWTELGGLNSLSANDEIYSIISDSSGNIYAAGAFKNANGKQYVAKYTPQSLPLKLLSFTAQKENNNVLLNWQTANEVNVSHINVQRSLNVKDFINIGKVSVGVSGYSFLDDKLPNTHDKLTLNYRLEIVDKDGSKTYSEIRNVELGIRNGAISVYPNPAKEQATIECKGAKEIMIIDCLGRTVYRSTVDSQPLTVNTKQLPKGLYVVKVITNIGETKTEKLIVE